MSNEENKLQIRKLSEVELQEVGWPWYPYIPYGKITIIQGDPGDSFISGGVVENNKTSSATEGVDFNISGEYIIIDETEFLSLRVENLGKTTGSGRLEVYRQNEDGTQTLVHSEEINALMARNIKYYLLKLEKDFFLQTADDFRCVIISDADENPDNNETTILARKLEGQSGTQRDLLVEAPEMTDHKATLDRYEPADITLSITMNEDILHYGTIETNMAVEQIQRNLRIPIIAVKTAANLYSCTTNGIAAKQMGDSRYYCAYAKLPDGNYTYSPIYEYSPKKYALSRLANSTDEKLKALCVAMLNYGAAAQAYFGYRTDELMNESLTDEQKALVVSYDPTLFAGAIPADSTKTGSFVQTDIGFSNRSATVSFDGAFAINYYLQPNAVPDGEITFYYWTALDYGKAATLTGENASGRITMGNNGDGTYYARITGIAPKQMDDTYYAAAVYSNPEGTYCSGIIAYSLSRYCMNNAKDGKPMKDLAAATAVYGYHAKQYFAQ